MSISRRLLLGLLAGLLPLFAVSGTCFYLYLRAALVRQFDAALTAEARAICSLIKRQPTGEVECELPQEPISQLDIPGRAYFQIWHEDGSVLVRSPALGQNDLPRLATIEARASTFVEALVIEDVALPADHPGRGLGLCFIPPLDEEDAGKGPTPRNSAAAKWVLVAVAQDRSELDHTLTLLISALLVVAAIMASGTLVIVALVVRRGLQPLQRVADEAARIDEQSLDVRFSLGGMPRELRPICLRLNDSLDRLQIAFQRERRFTADVAHELRTPIAELRSLADVALKWDGDPQTSATYFQDAQDIARQMEGIVTTLLSLARCQSGLMTATRESVKVVEVIQAAWSACEAKAVERKLKVAFDLAPQLVIDADRTMLASIVGNLLSNAVEHAAVGGSICCTAQRNGSTATIDVANDADTLAADDLPHLFEPFWRKDPARTNGFHCGLGLTLVEAYARMLDARVQASLRGGSVLSVCVALPVNGRPE